MEGHVVDVVTDGLTALRRGSRVVGSPRSLRHSSKKDGSSLRELGADVSNADIS